MNFRFARMSSICHCLSFATLPEEVLQLSSGDFINLQAILRHFCINCKHSPESWLSIWKNITRFEESALILAPMRKEVSIALQNLQSPA